MRLSDIDLRLLRVFKAVAESGGFVKAQGGLGISQPAISSHIANLEQRLNTRLCNRGPQGFSLTTAGQEVLDETNRILAQLEAYAQRLENIGTRAHHQIRLGVVDCTVTDPANPLAQAMSYAKTRQPDVKIRVGVYDYLDCLTELRNGRLDVALIGLARDNELPKDLEAIALYEKKGGLYCAPTHPCGQARDADARFAALKEAKISAHSFLLNPISTALPVQLLEEEMDLSQGNIEATAYLCLAGTHVGLMPLHFASSLVASGALIQLDEARYETVSYFHAVRIKGKATEESTQTLWDYLSGLKV